MTPAGMAALHAACFAKGAAWSETEVATLLDRPGTLAVSAGDHGFALLQIIPPEAELLTIAIAPDRQGMGCATALLQDAMTRAARAGATVLFLEVGAANTAARRLYHRAGFVQVGRRAGYYAPGDGGREDALILSCDLPAKHGTSPTPG